MSLISSLIPALKSAPASVVKCDSPGAAVSENAPKVTPRYDLTETPEAFGVVVDLPGVAKDDLDLRVDNEQVRVTGRRAWRKPEGWTVLHRESLEAVFELVLDHGRSIDVDKVHAELRDGVLRVSLPKAEALKPRKIAVA